MVPLAILGVDGVTVMDTSVTGFTVSVADAETPPKAAVIVVVPSAVEVANPLDPATLLMAATVASDEVQFASVVRSCVVLSENIPVALN